MEVWPVSTNAAFLARCRDEPDFVAGRVDTGFIGARLDALIPTSEDIHPALIAAAAVARIAEPDTVLTLSPWEAPPGPMVGFRINGGGAPVRLGSGTAVIEALVSAEDATRWSAEVDAFSFSVEVARDEVRVDGARYGLASRDGAWVLFHDGDAHIFTDPLLGEAGAEAAGDGSVTSPMPGRIVAVQVAKGDRVAKGAPLLTLEAMKMEHVLTAPFDAVVEELDAVAGSQVAEGVVLVKLAAV